MIGAFNRLRWRSFFRLTLLHYFCFSEFVGRSFAQKAYIRNYDSQPRKFEGPLPSKQQISLIEEVELMAFSRSRPSRHPEQGYFTIEVDEQPEKLCPVGKEYYRS